MQRAQSLCMTCANADGANALVCKAFPGGIPSRFWMGVEGHFEAEDGQQDDHVFKSNGSMPFIEQAVMIRLGKI